MRTLNLLVVSLCLCCASARGIDVRTHGAIGDGNTDDTAAIQTALDIAASEHGGIVNIPKGTYLIKGNLNIPEGVCLKGEWEAPHHSNPEQGTLLLAVGNEGIEDASPLIFLNQSSALKGVTIYYPNQNPLKVVPYPWTIQGKGMHGSVIDVTLVNPYKGIDFGTYHNELHHIRNVFGCPLKLGVYINATTDIGRVENVHFNPHYWERTTLTPWRGDQKSWDGLLEYLEGNLVGFLIGQTDWEYISNCFVIFPKIGWHFIKTERGFPNAVLTQCGSDVGPLAVQVDASQSHAGLAFTNCQFMGTIATGPENKGPVKLVNCGFWPIPKTGSQAILKGQGTVIFEACHFADWDMDNTGKPCIDLMAGVALIQSCDFMEESKLQIRVGTQAGGMTLVSSRLRGGEKVEIAAEAMDRVQKGFNLVH